MSLQFTLAPEPELEAREKGRLLFAGPVDFVKGVVAMSGLPEVIDTDVCAYFIEAAGNWDALDNPNEMSVSAVEITYQAAG